MKPSECLLAPREESLIPGFELFLRATEAWAVDPPGNDPGEAPSVEDGTLKTDSPSWLDAPFGPSTLTARQLLESWGCQNALSPVEWNLNWDHKDEERAAEKVGCGEYTNGTRALYETKLTGLEKSLAYLEVDPQSSPILFKFLWNRLTVLSSLEPASAKWRGASSRPSRKDNPICAMLQWSRYKPYLVPVEDQGPISLLRSTRWIPVGGQLKQPSDVVPSQLQAALNNSPYHTVGHDHLVKLLGLMPEAAGLTVRVGELERINQDQREELEKLHRKLAEFQSQTDNPPVGGGNATGGEGPQGGNDPKSPEGRPYADLNYPEDLPYAPPGGPSEPDGWRAETRLVELLGDRLVSFARLIIPGTDTLIAMEAASCLVSFHQGDLLRTEVGNLDGDILREQLIQACLDREEDFAEHTRKVLGINRKPCLGDFSKRWYPGGHYARWITMVLGFPPAFAGRPSDPKLPAEEVWIPLRNPGELRPYQEEFVAYAERSPLLIQIPTGSGKTRIGAERVLNALAKGTEPNKVVLWIAPGETLCEQAIETLKNLSDARSVAMHRKEPSPSIVFRRWFGGRTRDQVVHPEGHSVIVATYATMSMLGAELVPLVQHTVLAVLDEAHRAVAEKWEANLRHLMEAGVPFLGLSATPDEAVGMLGNPIEITYFNGERAQAVLSRDGVLALPVKSDITYAPLLTGLELPTEDEGENVDYLPWRQRLAEHPQRREAILDWIRSHLMDERARVLLFGASLNDALGLTVVLNQAGIKAEYVSGKTGSGARRRIETRFRTGETRVLCNYGVYTTGFDEPSITAVVIARPTLSGTLYTQMAGRGLRTTDGKNTCCIADVIDLKGKRMAKDSWWEAQSHS